MLRTLSVPAPWPPIFDQPEYVLGDLDVFASPDELALALGVGINIPPGRSAGTSDRRLGIALLVATRHVLHCLGYSFTDAVFDPEPASIPVVPVACRSSWRQATIAAAVRFYKSPDVPFGVAGGWDMATYVRMSIPDVDMILLGERVAFGIA